MRRSLAIGAAALFVLSSVFPVVAGLSKDTSSFPKWWGVADVAIAFTLAIVVMIIVASTQGKVTAAATAASYRWYRVLLHGILAFAGVFFIAGDRIMWSHCLTGFAWRAWVLLYALPAWFSAVKAKRQE